MLKIKPVFILLLIVQIVTAQDVGLPLDLRQHNLNTANTSIMNPAYSLSYENSQSVGLWSRWQWQSIDADPTSLFVNYVGKLDEVSSMGAGFYQHNTGIFLNTGAVINYAYKLNLSDRAQLAFGVNVFAYLAELADNRYQIDPQIEIPLLGTTEDFIVQIAPGVRFTYDQLSIGITSENLFGYNVTTKENSRFSRDKIFAGNATYDLPVNIMKSDSTSILRPMVYVKTIPGYDTQVGLNTLLVTNKFWAQTGYNSFYGFSIGAGGRFFRRLSLGAVVELGSSKELKGKDPTFELVTSFDFGKIEPRKKIKRFEGPEEKPLEEIAEADKLKEELSKTEELAARKEAKQLEREKRTRAKDSLILVRKEEAIAVNLKKKESRRADSINRVNRAKKAEESAIARNLNKQKRTDSLTAVKKQRELAAVQKRQDKIKQDSIRKAESTRALAEVQKQKERVRLDSLKHVENAKALALAAEVRNKRRIDSIANAKLLAAEVEKQKEAQEQVAEKEEDAKPKAGEKYEEAVVGEDGLEPGYYLIANVFGTKKYFDIFMADLTKKGLKPKSFFRSMNKYNYVYLERYNSMNEARQARDNDFGGRYSENTWIYRVVGN